MKKKVINILTNNKSCKIKLEFLKLKSDKTPIKIIAKDNIRENSVYFDKIEYPTNDKVIVEIRLPLSPKELKIIIASSYKFDVKFSKNDLQFFKPCLINKYDFIPFILTFSEKCGILGESKCVSENNKYVIDLLNDIKDRKTGVVLKTPARISNKTGRIEVCKRMFDKFTIPMRIAILFHEISHFYINDIQKDEIEADLNGLRIYLALNFPLIEGLKAFTRTFKSVDTSQNRERYNYILSIVKEFKNIKNKIC